MPDNTDLNVGFGTPFQAQIDYLRNKLRLPTERWDDIQRSAYDRAFVVAGAAKADLLADLHQAVIKAAEDGTGLAAFQRDFKGIVAKHGGTGWTGEGTPEGEAWRTRVIYQTNMSTSYWGGRYGQMKDPEYIRFHPYWRYLHSDGVLHPRLHHLAWHGITLRHDHPFWQTHSAPNGWGCQCRITTVSKREGEASAAAGLGEPPEDWDKINPKTGEPIGIDKGFGYQPGAGVGTPLQKMVDEKLIRLSPELAKALAAEVKQVLGSQTVPARPVADAEFLAFFKGDAQTPAKVAVADLTDADRALFNTSATELWLSRTTLDEHKIKHPEIGADDYAQIARILQEGQVWAGPQNQRFVLLTVAGKPYRAAIKTDESGKEAWFLSLVVSPKQKPPKGAVQIR